jgi:hypothetical protein
MFGKRRCARGPHRHSPPWTPHVEKSSMGLLAVAALRSSPGPARSRMSNMAL